MSSVPMQMHNLVKANNFEQFKSGAYYNAKNGETVILGKMLGIGGFGKVFRENVNGADIAVKIMHFHDRVKRIFLRKEITFLGKCTNTGYTSNLLGYTRFRDCYVVEMELLGPSLESLQMRRPSPYFSHVELKSITHQLLKAIEFLHGKGITHCDLKPANVCVAEDRSLRLKLVDFGHALAEDQLDILKPGLEYGTICYESPEFIFGLTVTPKIDIWSIGLTVAEVLIGGNVVFNVYSRGELVRNLEVARLVPFAAMNSPWLQKYRVPPAEGYRRPAPFTDVKAYLYEKTRGLGWTHINKNIFIEYISNLIKPDYVLRPSASEALQRFPH